MAKVVDFLVVFGEGVRKRHYHETEKGEVTYFAVQLGNKALGSNLYGLLPK
jgi:hypothetical protein